MKWSGEKTAKYHEFARFYVAAYSQKIDCADLAIAALVEFAKKEGLPVRFKYYDKSSQWVAFDPAKDDAQEFKRRAMIMFGALNVIDNTKTIPIAAAKPGGFHNVEMEQFSRAYTSNTFDYTGTKQVQGGVVSGKPPPSEAGAEGGLFLKHRRGVWAATKEVEL